MDGEGDGDGDGEGDGEDDGDGDEMDDEKSARDVKTKAKKKAKRVAYKARREARAEKAADEVRAAEEGGAKAKAAEEAPAVEEAEKDAAAAEAEKAAADDGAGAAAEVIGDDEDDSAIVFAATRGDLRRVQALLREGADVNQTARRQWLEKAGKEIISAGSEPSAPGTLEYEEEFFAGLTFGWTPLLAAAKGNHLELVREILAHKSVRVNVAANDAWGQRGDTPLNMASKWGHYEVVGALVAFEGVRVNERTGYWGAMQTPLHQAVEGGHIEAVKALLAHKGVRVNVGESDGEGREGDTPLDTAEAERPHGNSDEIAGILRAAGAKTRKQIVEDAEEAAARLEAGAQWMASRYGVQPPFVGVARMAGVIERA